MTLTIIEPSVGDYLGALTPPRQGALSAMEAYAKENSFPIIGPLVGRFLQQLVRLSGAQHVFEMGSGYGYSALWMAMAMDARGKIECTEADANNIRRGEAYFQQAGLTDRVVWRHGDALDAMRRVDGPFDLILNDVNKAHYPDALGIAWPKLRRGGVMVTDNALWSGRVVSEPNPDADTRGVIRMNQLAYALPDAVTTLIPLRDGLLISVKL
jgi:predicted O-methyltransferase YrrM